MPITENIVHKKYRILVDEINDIWDRLSFWRDAGDIELSSGTDLETDLANKDTALSAGVTNMAPIANSPTTEPYLKNTLIMYEGQLYKTKAALVTGTTLTPGYNIDAVTVSTLSQMLTATDGAMFYFDYKDGAPGFYTDSTKTTFIQIA